MKHFYNLHYQKGLQTITSQSSLQKNFLIFVKFTINSIFEHHLIIQEVTEQLRERLDQSIRNSKKYQMHTQMKRKRTKFYTLIKTMFLN